MQNIRVSEVLRNRSQFTQVIIVAILIALGTNVLAGAILSNVSLSFWTAAVIGLFLIVLGVCIVGNFVLVQKGEIKTCEGALFFDALDGRTPLEVEGYGVSEKFTTNFKALFAENKAVLHTWENSEVVCSTEALFDADLNVSKSNTLIREALEYILIEELSLNLSTHFESASTPAHLESRVETIGRNDVPEILLKNRFLETFSKSPEDRGNPPIFKRPDFWTSRGKFQFHGGGDAADAHVRALVVVSP